MDVLTEVFKEYNMTLSEDVKKDIACSVVQTFPSSQRCQFVLAAEDCIRHKSYISYINLLFCDFGSEIDFFFISGVLFILLILLVLFLILATVIDKVFCPALKVIAVSMGMNEHLAGCTLVAFGGCSPDVLTSVFSKGDAKGMISEVIGNSFYVSCFIGGLIIVLAPFEMQAYSTFRDICFLLFSLLYIDHALRSNNCVTFVESSVILIIYGVYLLVLIVDQVMLKKTVKKLERRVSEAVGAGREQYNKLDKMRGEAGIEIVNSRASRVSMAMLDPANFPRPANQARVSVNIADTRDLHYMEFQNKNADLFKHFLYSVNPIDFEEFMETGNIGKTGMIIRAPITFLLMLFLPIIDYEMPRHGWSKLLNCCHIITSPIMFMLAFSTDTKFFGIPIWAISPLISIPLAIVIFYFSRTDVPPSYHLIFGLFASTGSVTVIYICALEVLQILHVIGIVTGSSSEFLGCMLLSWGMSIGDLISNVMLALHGYQRMGYAACFGSPMFNNVLIVGGHYMQKAIRSDSECVEVTVGDLDENCMNFMLLSLVFTLFFMMLTNCHARRSVGIFLIGMYLAFFIYTLLGELAIVHSFAADEKFFEILR